MSQTLQRKNRTLSITVEDLMKSLKLKIAIRYYEHFPEILESMFITLGEASQQVARSVMISEFNKYSSKTEVKLIKETESFEAIRKQGLDQFEMAPYLRSITEFPRYNTWWKLSSGIEQELYIADPLFKLDADGRATLAEIVRNNANGGVNKED